MQNNIKEFKSNARETLKDFQGSADYQIIRRSIEITFNTLYGHAGSALWNRTQGSALIKEIEESI